MAAIDWLLVLLRAPSQNSPAALDPIRIQKALFYISRKDQVPTGEKYEFEPYNYGPYSRQIYADLDVLVASGLVALVPDASRRWSRYALTSSGSSRVDELLPMLSVWVDLIESTRELVTGLSFRDLLRRVYREFPEFAVNSIANV